MYTEQKTCDITLVFVPTAEIARALHTYRNSILKFNPRSYLELSHNQVNQEIARSITGLKTNEFALFNNGITVLSYGTDFNEKIGQKDKAQLILTQPQIINGGQTAFTLSRLYEQFVVEGSDKQIFDSIVSSCYCPSSIRSFRRRGFSTLCLSWPIQFQFTSRFASRFGRWFPYPRDQRQLEFPRREISPDTLGMIFERVRLKPGCKVTLSACETGLVRPDLTDEYLGLPSGFLFAGASSILASLWAVDDTSTMKLMKQIYEGFCKDKMSLSASLRQAQISLKSQHTYRHPYFWAAFQTIGAAWINNR